MISLMEGRALPRAVVGGLSLAGAWLVPGSAISVLLGWIAVFLIVTLPLETKHPYRLALVVAVISHALAFHWLIATITDFGGFPIWLALIVFMLFCLFGSVQFLAFVFFTRTLPDGLSRLGVRTACAWSAAEMLPVQIFPWSFAHTQLAFSPLAQIADLGGCFLISFLMLWSCEVFYLRFAKQSKLARPIPYLPVLVLAALLASISYGFITIDRFSKIIAAAKEPGNSSSYDVVLVQANISLSEKHNIKSFQINVDRYMELSAPYMSEESLVIWPETVILEFIPDNIRLVSQDPRLPNPKLLSQDSGKEVSGSLLIGSITFETFEKYFNSALVITSDGRVLPPYHKQILMPFGEYTPLGKTFPWLIELNSTAGQFTAGKKGRVFDVPTRRGISLKVSPLICYEDIVPSLAREAVRSGAQVLVNMTNDAWFGDTVALYQHHLIASFRAIENRRFLLRSTNTGVTAVVDPTGQTVSQLKPYSEGVLRETVALPKELTVYTKYVGSKPSWLVLILCVASIVWRLRERNSAGS